MNEKPARQGHAVLDHASRTAKAHKIERVIAEYTPLAGIRLLDFGCGSGHVASHFGRPSGPSCDVDAVDVDDHRKEKEFYRFTRIKMGQRLPWDDSDFDVVISNHVLEHVGDRGSQVAYLRELCRLLTPGGIGYVAVPNRWMLVEPHYRLLFLSWLPDFLRTPYLRISGKGRYYDCAPPSVSELEDMLDEAGLDYENICFRVLAISAEVEGKFTLAARLVSVLPVPLLRLLVPAIPTLCYFVRRGDST